MGAGNKPCCGFPSVAQEPVEQAELQAGFGDSPLHAHMSVELEADPATKI